MECVPLWNECLDMIEALYDEAEDVSWPVLHGMHGITLCGSEGRYVLRTGQKRKPHAKAKAVLKALVKAEKQNRSEDPLAAVHQTLEALTD
ncbi:hypothetical protein [Humidesulfovibrio sp.]